MAASDSSKDMGGVFGGSRPWKPARDVIDWSIKGQSIFSRKKPLSPKTIDRIAHGIRKYAGKNAEPFLVMLYGTGKTRSIHQPVPTITANGQHIAVCEPFILPQQAGRPGQLRTRSVNDPLPAITTKGAEALVQPFLIHLTHAGGKRVHGLSHPVPTVTCANRGEMALVEPFLVKYYGTGNTASVDSPLDTVTTKARFGLVENIGYDITLRMLEPHELAAAMSFDSGYQFSGTKTDQIKQIGNAVPVRTATALCRAMLEN